MKLKIILLVFLGGFFYLHAHDTFEHIDLKAEAAILINATNGQILFEKNKDLTIFPASTTKVATALFILKEKSFYPNALIQVKKEALRQITGKEKVTSSYRSPPYWLEPEGSGIDLKNGEEFFAKDLFSAMLISSANDAANVLGHHYGPTLPVFLKELNIFLKKIGCQHTHFLNPHGLHHPAHVTTVADLALITREALKDPFFRETVNQTKYAVTLADGSEKYLCHQTNRLIKEGPYFYPKAFGIKTGTTQMAGKNLIAVAKSSGRELIAIGMGYRDLGVLYKEITNLFETAFHENLQRSLLLSSGKQEFTIKVKGARKKLLTSLPDGLFYDFYPSEKYDPAVSLEWHIPALPIKKDSVVGKLTIKNANTQEIVKEEPLLAYADLKAHLIFQLFSFIKHHQTLTTIFLTILLLFYTRRRLLSPRRPLNTKKTKKALDF